MHPLFQSVWIPIVTPFAQGQIDHPSLARLSRHLADQGTAGLVLGATTGEGCSLSLNEKGALFETVRSELGEDYPLMLGICEADTRTACDQANALAHLEPDAFLVTTPPYLRPSQAGLQGHFEAVVEAADRPVVLYNIPYRTSVCLELETLQHLQRDARVVGLKECGASVDRLMQLISETSLNILIGEDSQYFAALCLGAHGCISATAHLCTDVWVRIDTLVRAGDWETARHLAYRLQGLIRASFTEPNPAPIKAALAAIGMIGAEIRLPHLPASVECCNNVRTAMRTLMGL
jgi:4-hydroxy-tetrahydrodipicolinate synthase